MFVLYLAVLDGRTVYERITWHKGKTLVIGFAEMVYFKDETNQPHIFKDDFEWGTCVFLGYVWSTLEYSVGTADGVFTCPTIRWMLADTS